MAISKSNFRMSVIYVNRTTCLAQPLGKDELSMWCGYIDGSALLQCSTRSGTFWIRLVRFEHQARPWPRLKPNAIYAIRLQRLPSTSADAFDVRDSIWRLRKSSVWFQYTLAISWHTTRAQEMLFAILSYKCKCSLTPGRRRACRGCQNFLWQGKVNLEGEARVSLRLRNCQKFLWKVKANLEGEARLVLQLAELKASM